MSTISATLPLRAYALLFAAMAVVGSYVALSKPLLAVLPVFVLALLRYAIAGVATLHWLRPEAGQRWGDTPSRVYAWLLLQSFLGSFLFTVCMLYGVQLAGAVTAGVALACIPAFIALLSWVFLREALTVRLLAAVVCCVAAVWVLQVAGADENSVVKLGAANSADYLIGTALLLAAAACEASYIVIAKRLGNAVSPKRASALLNAWGLLLVLPFGLWQWAQGHALQAMTAPLWLLLVYYALAASAISTWLWFSGIRAVPASQAGVFTVALPLTAAAIGAVFLGETVTAWHAVALLLGLAGIVVANWPQKRP